MKKMSRADLLMIIALLERLRTVGELTKDYQAMLTEIGKIEDDLSKEKVDR